jgi:hypothetical protein
MMAGSRTCWSSQQCTHWFQASASHVGCSDDVNVTQGYMVTANQQPMHAAMQFMLVV